MTTPLPRPANDNDSATLTTGQIMAVVLPMLAVIAGFGLWLWSAYGPSVFYDVASALIAICM